MSKSKCAGTSNIAMEENFSRDGMFAFTAVGDFVRKAAGKLSKDGNFAEEGNFPTKDNFAKEGELTKESEFTVEGNFVAIGNCNMVTTLPKIVVWIRTGSPPSLPQDTSLPWNATGEGTKACEFAYNGKFAKWQSCQGWQLRLASNFTYESNLLRTNILEIVKKIKSLGGSGPILPIV